MSFTCCLDVANFVMASCRLDVLAMTSREACIKASLGEMFSSATASKTTLFEVLLDDSFVHSRSDRSFLFVCNV